MALLALPDNEQIFKRVNEEPVSYGFFDNSVPRVYSIIEDLELITTAAATAENAADAAAAPYDFPLPKTIIAERNPSFTQQQIDERYLKQSAPFARFIIDKAAADLVLSLKPDMTRLDQATIEWRRESLLQSANDSLKAGVTYVQNLLVGQSVIPDPSAQSSASLSGVRLFRAD